MLKKFRITVDGKPYSVTVEETQDGAAPSQAAAAPQVKAAAPAAAAPAPVAAAPAPAAQSGGPGDQPSPLAGVVVSIGVALGQQVSANEPIAVVEAMKMHTTVASVGGGTVTAIHVKAGDAVDAGQAILTLG